MPTLKKRYSTRIGSGLTRKYYINMESLPGTNGVAYSAPLSVTKKKSFFNIGTIIRLHIELLKRYIFCLPEPNVTKLFMVTIDKCS